MSVYLRYFSITIVLLAAAVPLLAGTAWTWLSFAIAVFIATGGDAILGNDTDRVRARHPWIFNLQLYGALPLLWLFSAVFAWYLGDGDFLGMGAAVHAWTGYDMFAARAASEWWHLIGGGLAVGLMFGAVGTVIGHELTHRTWSKPAMITGRWLLALTADASFAIEHVYGHHVNVATKADPATARRGENAWWFVLRSTVQSYLHAWKLERERLERLGHSVWSWRNRMHRGNLMTLAYASAFYAAAGWVGVAVYGAVAAYGKSYLEFVNYLEHYGLVRVPGEPVEPRHSWNCNHRMSSWLLFNLTRHSHHHAEGEKPFWELEADVDAPVLPYGYLTMIYIAAVPPLWHRIMSPRVKAWDRRFATASERPLIEEANRESGRPEFLEEDLSEVGLEPASA